MATRIYDLVLSDWKSVPGGSKRAHTLSFQLNGTEVQRLTIKEISINQPIAPDTFPAAEPYQLASAVEVPANADYQWVIRRLFLGSLIDNDLLYSAGGLKLVELAPNVQHVVGGSHNSMIVAMNDSLVVFDAPINEGQSRWVIDAAKAKYPGKPIKYLVMTHHHMDHSSGTRTYVAEGATLVVPGQARPFFEKMIAAPHTIRSDALTQHPRSATIVDVKDVMSIKDGTLQINLYNIPNPHVDGMIIGHLVEPNLGVGDGPNLATGTDCPQCRNGCGWRCAAAAQHSERHVCRRPRRNRQAGRYRRGAGCQLADKNRRRLANSRAPHLIQARHAARRSPNSRGQLNGNITVQCRHDMLCQTAPSRCRPSFPRSGASVPFIRPAFSRRP